MLRRVALSTALLVCIAATASGAVLERDHARGQPPLAAAAAAADSDHDGLSDRLETRKYHTNPRRRDTDRDGLRDRAEIRHYHTNPRRRDTDRDGLRDRAEIRRYHTNPRRRDTDRDGLWDRAEIRRYHTNPRRRDTDRDGFSDGVEVRAGTDPRDPRSHPPGNGAKAPGNPAGPGGGGSRPSGFPNATSTGVPAGTALSPYSGPSEISTPNTVIDGKTIGCITVRAPGVVIRNSKLSCGDPGADVVSSPDGAYTGARLLIEDSEIDCKGTGGTAVGDTNITAVRLDIQGCENGFDIDANVTVQDSYIHDLYNSSEAHTDGIQLASGHYVGASLVPGALNVTITHNTIYGVGADGSLGTSAIISNSGGDTNILIQGNLLAGGAFTLYCEQGTQGVNYRVTDNHFSRKFSSKVGAYGPSTDCSDETQSGNVFHETAQPVTLS